jgi:hypothetical protein
MTIVTTVVAPRAQASSATRIMAAGLFAMGWIVAATAVAQTPAVSSKAPAALRVSGAAGCLEQSTVEDQVHERSSRIEFVPATPSIPRLTVTLQRHPGRAFAVELAVAWPNGKRSRRRLAANSCDEAASAVAFLIALTLDPASFAHPGANQRAASPREGSDRTEGVAPAEEQTGSGGDATAATSPGDSAQGAPLAEAARESGATANAPTSDAEKPTREPTATAAASGTNDSVVGLFAFDYIGFGVGGQLALGIAPSAMTGLAVQAMLAFHGRGLWVPALQLSAAHVWVGDLAQSGGVADFQRTTVRVDVCPVGLRASVLTARGCLTSALGSLTAQGSQSYASRSSARLWTDVGTSLLASADLGSLFQVLAGLTLAVPLRRDQFAFRPDVFHTVATLGWEGHLGLVVRFP